MSRPPKTIIARFLGHSFVDETGCWLWTSQIDKDGYAKFFTKRGGEQYAHRFAYTYFIGPIPKGLLLDHLCRVRGCVNPRHLEPVTNRENILRGRRPQREQTRCIHGHPYDETNTHWAVGRNGRHHRKCRACHAAGERKRRAARRLAA